MASDLNHLAKSLRVDLRRHGATLDPKLTAKIAALVVSLDDLWLDLETAQ